VYLDIGKFGGLAETMDESIRYAIRTPHDGAEMAPCILAGPTCDSADVLYEKSPYPLPVTLEIGDKLLIEAPGPIPRPTRGRLQRHSATEDVITSEQPGAGAPAPYLQPQTSTVILRSRALARPSRRTAASTAPAAILRGSPRRAASTSG